MKPEENGRLKAILWADFGAMERGRATLPHSWELIGLYWRRLAFRVVVNYRIGHWCRQRGWWFLGAWFDHRNWRLGVDIDSNAEIGKGLRMAHPHGIVISGHVVIGDFAQIQQNVTLGGNFRKRRSDDPAWTAPRLGDHVFVGPGAVLVGPISVGDRAVIGANAVVTRDVAPGATVGGVPGRVLRCEKPGMTRADTACDTEEQPA